MNQHNSIERHSANELFRFKKKQLNKILSSKIDKVEIASALLSVYRNLSQSEPEIDFASGPREAADKLAERMGWRLSKAKLNQNRPGERTSSPVPLRKQLDLSVFSALKRLKAKVKDELGDSVFREAVNILFRDLNFQISQAVYQQVERALVSIPHLEVGATEFNPHPAYADWDWISFYRGCSEVMDVLNDEFADFERLLHGGFYAGYFYRDFCIVVTKPNCIRRNENLVLHDEDLPAIEWDDGTKLCFWNGIHVPEKLICDPLSVKADDILQETNAEVRRCFQEKLGSERFGSLLGLIVLDRKSDRFGNESILYRTQSRDKLAGDHIYFAKVVCPSTGRSYFLCVPPWMKGVEQAISWTFGKTPEDYKPLLET